MTDNSKKADYSIASPEEREAVVQILNRNTDDIVKQRRTRDPDRLRKLVERLCSEIRGGAIFTGKDFQVLIGLFRKQPPF